MARKAPRTLDEQLSSVIEQDGKVLNTPQGVKRKRKTVASLRHASDVVNHLTAHDDIAALDRATVNVIVGKGGGIPQEIKIRHEEHVRSPYVVSLQKIVVNETANRSEPRTTARIATPFGEHRPVEAYAAVSSDLTGDADPWFTSQQFTPSTFEESYRAVYGKKSRWLVACGAAVGSVGRLFQRIERIEEQAVTDVKVALEVVEVRRFSYVRALAAFAGLALVVTLPANAIALYRSASIQKNAAEDAGVKAVSSLSAATGASTLPESAAALRQASGQFRAVDALLGDASNIAVSIASVLKPNEYRSARALAEAGDKSSEAARLLALGFDKVFSDPGRRLDERLDVLGAYANSALRLLSDASRAAASVDASSIPEAQRDKAAALFGKLEDSTHAVREFSALSGILANMAGKQELRKYLLVFQNPRELRPTGGFMGSFAEITVDRGAVKNIRVPPGGTYDLKGMLLARVKPPKPLQLIADRWQFQDANWSPDFPTAAKKIRWFWSKSGQSTVDGVISVNATFVERLLDVTGPIPMPKYGKTVDASNFLLETQKAVELEYDKTANTPKKFIGDLSTELVARLKDLKKDQWIKVAGLISEALNTKDIQLALSNPDEEALAERYGWSGQMKQTVGDSLALIEANVAGQKTDGVITERVDHRVSIADDGSVTDHVTLTRTHTGKKGDLFQGVRNVSYLRAYVPEGSTLVSASGFSAPSQTLFKKPDDTNAQDADLASAEMSMRTTPDGITTAVEDGHTTFGGWMQLDPGQSQTIEISYRLPMTVGEILQKADAEHALAGETPNDGSNGTGRGAYLLLLTNQSGKTDRKIRTTVEYPHSWDVAWHRPDDLQSATANVTYDGTWDRDRAIALFFTPTHEQTKTTQSSSGH